MLPARICPVFADNPHRAHRIPSRPYFCLCNEANMLFPARAYSYLFGPDKFAQLSAAGQPSRFPSLASASFALTTFIHPPGISHQLAILCQERKIPSTKPQRVTILSNRLLGCRRYPTKWPYFVIPNSYRHNNTDHSFCHVKVC